jgi:restriction system protein
LPSGQQAIFHNRVAWANTHLKKAGLLRAPRRGFFTVTDRGKSVLAQNPSRIDRNFPEQFPEFLAFVSKSKTVSEADHFQSTEPSTVETPLESLEAAYGKILGERKSELLDRLKGEAPAVFERIVIELLVKMGYGGSRADVAQAIGKSGDEGSDGIIKEDRLASILSTSKRSGGRDSGSSGDSKASILHHQPFYYVREP